MGQQVSVETFTSTADPDGNKYWASFDPYPFKVGSRKLVYLGILNGDGPLKGQKCVVKTTRRNVINRRDWMLEKQRTQKVREIADAYNKTVHTSERKICINGPIIAEIDTLSDCMCLNDLIGKPKKKFKEADYVSIELFMKGKFEDFEYGWVPEKDLVVTEAFSHFSWCQSEGRLLVSNLQGVKTSKVYQFTGPVLHSEDKSFGSTDLGMDGIKGFFKLHVCNRICKHWPRLGSGVDLRGWGKHMVKSGGYPSAPPLPGPPSYASVCDRTNAGRQAFSNMTARDIANMQIQNRSANTESNNESHNAVPYSNMMSFGHPPTTMLPNRNQYGVVFDWREEFAYQNMVLGPYGPSENESTPFNDIPFMWVVKQMYYGFYNQPPPYQTDRPDINREHAQRQVEHSKSATNKHCLDYYEDEDDQKCLLPPPYSEENVDPRYEYTTYL